MNFSLKISPREQTKFIAKVFVHKRHFSKSSISVTRSLLYKGKILSNWCLYGKSNLGTEKTEGEKPVLVRWFVGWVEKEGYFYVFAYLNRKKAIDVDDYISKVRVYLEEFLISVE